MIDPTTPGLRFEVVPPPAPPEPLRSDVAVFLGATRRGPVGEAVRIEEWRDYQRVFGGLGGGALTPYAVRSYFENGGQVAWIVRLAGIGTFPALGTWPPPAGSPLPGHRVPAGGGASEAFLAGGAAVTHFDLAAATPGAWAEGGRVLFRYRRRGPSGGAEIDAEVRVAGEAPEILRGLPARDALAFAARVNESSRLLRLTPDLAPAALLVPAPAALGPARREWDLVLTGGADAPPGRAEYLAAVETAGRQREIALVALPDLYRHLSHGVLPGAAPSGQQAFEVLKAAVVDAERRHDRLVLVDLPSDPEAPGRPPSSEEIAALLDFFGLIFEEEGRSAAVYHPWIAVVDPLGGVTSPLRWLPPSGAVAGLASRLDRERGAHHTPANAPLRDAVEAAGAFTPEEQGRLNADGVNLLRCFPNRGLTVWGGRTLSVEPGTLYVAHRRLLHRLVRAIRRVAEPLVFEVEGPELWLTFVRAITSVLLEAFRGGALKGARPEEAFRVRCDEETNPPEERELGRVTCVIELAPAVPMEFITLRVALGREGELEVFEK